MSTKNLLEVSPKNRPNYFERRQNNPRFEWVIAVGFLGACSIVAGLTWVYTTLVNRFP